MILLLVYRLIQASASLFVCLLPDNSVEGVGHDAAAVAVAAVVA